MYRDRRKYYGRRKNNNNKKYETQSQKQYDIDVSENESKKIPVSTITKQLIVAFVKSAVAIGVGVIVGTSFGFVIYNGVSLADVVILFFGATGGVLAVMCIFKYKLFNKK